MAMSVNGYIAREYGEEDFLSHKNWESFAEIAKECGCFIVGRKTYERVKDWGEEYNFDSLEVSAGVIITKNKNFKVGEKCSLASSPADAISQLKAKGFEKILVTGGATVNSAFIKEDLIDEIFLNVEPFVLSSGISLFSKEEFDCKLSLLGVKEIGDGILQLHYKISK